jgi:hypothetical protein
MKVRLFKVWSRAVRPPLGADGSLEQLTVSINRSQGTVGVAETKTGRSGLARFGNSDELLLIILNLLTFYFGDEFDHGLVVGLIKYFGLGIDVPIQT